MKKNSYDNLADLFIEDIFLLIKDFIEIDKKKEKEVGKIRKQLSKEAKSDNADEWFFNSNFERIQKYGGVRDSRIHFQNAMFTYLFALYEKHINELIKFSIKSDKSIRKRYLDLYLRYLKKDNKDISAAFLNLSKQKQTEHMLDFLRNVKYEMEDLKREQFLFKVPEKTFWFFKDLKFHFTEIRARRNLIVHRNNIFDNEYVEKMNQIEISKKANNPKATFNNYVKNGLYPKINNFDDFLKKEYKVVCNFSYFYHTFNILLRLYLTISNQVAMSPSIINMTSVKLNNLFLNQHQGFNFLMDGLDLLNHYERNYPDVLKNDSIEAVIFLKGNKLITINIWLSHFEDSIKSIKSKKLKNFWLKFCNVITKEKETLVKFFKEKKEPIYKIIVALSENRISDCTKLIKQVDVYAQMREWPLFFELFKNKTFSDAFDSQLKKSSKK